MKLFFAALGIALVLACGFASAMPLADFSSESVHIHLGKSSIVRGYVNNPNSTFANITVWLGGDYPTDLVRFSAGEGMYLTPDQRNLTVGLNPSEERTLMLVILSTSPKDGGYTITMNANTTADSSLKDYDAMKVFLDYSPNFPGLEFFSILLIIGFSGLIFWETRKRI